MWMDEDVRRIEDAGWRIEFVKESMEFVKERMHTHLEIKRWRCSHYSTTTTSTPSPPSQQQHPEPSSAVSLSPAADGKVVVDLKNSILTSSAGGLQSKNNTLSTTRKRTQHHKHSDQIKETHSPANLPASTHSGGGGGSDDEEELDGENSRKKLRLSRDQSLLLEVTFRMVNPSDDCWVGKLREMKGERDKEDLGRST